MPGPLDGDASRGRPAPGASWADDTIEVRDLDSSFDLGVFAAEHHAAPPPAPTPPPVAVDAPTGPASSVVAFPRSVAASSRAELLLRRIEARDPPETSSPAPDLPRQPEADGVRTTPPWLVAASAAAVVLVGVAVIVLLRGASPGRAGQSHVRIESTPAGARVLVDGHERGVTPLALVLEPSTHDVRVERGGEVQAFQVAVEAGRDSAHHVYLAEQPAANARRTGSPGTAAHVSVPGEGAVATTRRTPGRIVAPDAPGRGVPPVADRLARSTRTSVAAPRRDGAPRPAAPRSAPPPRDANGALAGWMRIEAPVDLQMFIDGRAVGSTRAARTLLAAGSHEVVLASDRAGFRTSQTVTVEAGQLNTVQVVVPDGSLSVETQPQTDVLVDGALVGATPIDRLALAVGVRQVVVRHPALGERSYEVVIREGQHTALSVDLRPR